MRYAPAPMRRRAFVSGSFASLALALSPRALAQPSARHQWRPAGPLDGREPADPSALTAEERRHVPVLRLPEVARAGRPFDLVVQIGVEPHVMTDAHRIEWIEIAIDESRVLVADLGPRIAYPIVRTSLVLDAPSVLTARAFCNQHGVWRTQRSVEVR